MNDTITLTGLVWDGERAPLAKALVAAQKAYEGVKKAATNPAFKSRYADLAHVVEGVVPALNAAGVAVIQSPSSDGNTVTLETVFLHESGASVTGALTMRPSKNDPQGIGSAITYARRYALLAMTGCAPEDDDGNAASQRQAPRQSIHSEPMPISRDEYIELMDLLTLSGADPQNVMRACGVSDLRDLPAPALPKLRAQLEARAAKRQAEAA